jgi:transposase-like protein
MPRRKYPEELWERCKALYVSGVSVREIAKQCGIPYGTVAARCDREKWNYQRLGLAETKAAMIPPEQRPQEIARIVSEARLATLQLEARAALELAKKTLAAVQGHSIDLQTLEDLLMAQEYRLNVWPTPKPAEELEVKQRLILHYHHELTEEALKDPNTLILKHQKGPPSWDEDQKQDHPPPDEEQGPPPQAA